MYTYGSFALLYGRNQHNIINYLPIKKIEYFDMIIWSRHFNTRDILVRPIKTNVETSYFYLQNKNNFIVLFSN